MNANEKKKKISGTKIILSAFLVCMLLAVPFVTNCLLIGEVTRVNDMFAGDSQRMEYVGGKVFVTVENRRLFRWIDRLLTGRPANGRDGAYVVGVYVEDPTDYAEGTRILALVRGGQEDSDPPGLGTWWITPLSRG